MRDTWDGVGNIHISHFSRENTENYESLELIRQIRFFVTLE